MGTRAEDQITAWLATFDTALQGGDVEHVLELFAPEECFWRDFVAFTWNIYTADTKDQIAALLRDNLTRVKPTGWEIDDAAFERPGGVVGAKIKFETSVGWARGFVWLKGEKCWIMMTAIWDLKGHEEKIGKRRPTGPTFGQVCGRKSWIEQRKEEEQELGHSKQPYCVIVGGGQTGLAVGARLKVLGVPTIIVEKNETAGDTWRNRYKSLSLHTPSFSDQFPYMSYPADWPILPSKDKLGDWFESYAKVMVLNYWCSTECKSASYDEKEGKWEVKVMRSSGTEVTEITLRPAHLIIACGLAGFPKVPTFPGAESFEGAQIHSVEYEKGADWKGKKCLVIGASTSAHDICLDLWEQGAAEVTMMQNSSTGVVRVQTFLDSRADADLPGTENDRAFDIDAFDLKSASLPFKVLTRMMIGTYTKIAERDAKFLEDLKKVGFQWTMGEDGSGLSLMLIRRGGGFYIDVGASGLLINGDVKLKSGVKVENINPKSVVFSDGSEVDSDVIIYATGFGNAKQFVEQLISQETADKVGLCWGLGSNTKGDPGPWEGELRNMYKPTAQPGLWIASGGFSHARFYSRYLAVQLKARMEGIPTPVYTPHPSIALK